MKRYLPLPSLLALLAAQAFAQIGAPVPGLVRYDGQPVQIFYGVPGNLVPGPTYLGPATAISFSDCGGLLVHDGHIKMLSKDGAAIASYESPETSPTLSIGRDLTTAVAWLPGTHTLLWSDGKALSAVSLEDSAFAGRVTSLSRISPQTVRFLISQPGGIASAVSVSLPAGDVISSDILPGVRGPAFSFDSDIFWVDHGVLEIETATGKRRTLAVPSPLGDLSVEQMSSHWIHLFSGSTGMHWALRLGDTPPVLSRLPAPGMRNSTPHPAVAEEAK